MATSDAGSPQNENVLFCKVEMSPPVYRDDLPFPSRALCPSAHCPAALTAPGSDAGPSSDQGKAGPFWRRDQVLCETADISTLR